VVLTKMPPAAYHIESGPGGGSTFYRCVPLIRQPRGALPVALGQQL